jgi:hypothetical protein
MDGDEVGKTRDRAQAALSRARLATDPEATRHWLEIADAWQVLGEAMEGKPPRRQKPGPVGKDPKPR